MTQPQMEILLRARGYERLEGVERGEGDRFRIAAAERFGVRVGPLLFDALDGQLIDEPPLTESQVQGLLRARGYVEVTQLVRDGDAIEARARREGVPFLLRIDAQTGAVRARAD
jgi:hypothetical protein